MRAALPIALLVVACGGASPSATEPAGSASTAPDLGPMRWTEAEAAHPRELCERIAAIMGPRIARECPEGGHEERGIDASQCGNANAEGMPSVPASCAMTVADFEACFRALAAMPECPGFDALAVMTGPECGPVLRCGHEAPAAETASEPAPAGS